MNSIEVNGVKINNLILMNSKFNGFDTLTKKKFVAGTKIAYKNVNNLTPQEKIALFGETGKCYNLSVVWEESSNNVENIPHIDDYRLPFEDLMPIKKNDNFTPSVYQNDIYQEVIGTNNHILIEALAGSGKTSTLVWLVKKLKQENRINNSKIIYLAFNKSIQVELDAKLNGTGVYAQTTHGFGLSILRRNFQNVKIENKIYDLFDEYFCNALGYEYTDYNLKSVRKNPFYKIKNNVVKIVGLIKNWGILPLNSKFSTQDIEFILSFFDAYNLEIIENISNEEIVNHALNLLLKTIPDLEQKEICISYDDMLYLPLYFNLKFPKYDLVLTDESQDFNAAQQSFLKILSANDSRIIVVGDKYQAIYRFRGADSNSFENIKNIIELNRNCEIKKLPINYRCDQLIIKRAQQIVPTLEGNSKAAGTVDFINYSKALDQVNNFGTALSLPDGINNEIRNFSNKKVTYAFLCRINAPLISTAYDLIGMGKKCHIIGRQEIGVPLKNIIFNICGNPESPNFLNNILDLNNPQGVLLIEGFYTKLDNYYNINMQKYQQNLEENSSKIDNLQQHVECLKIIMDRVKDNKVLSILQEIDSLFVDDEEEGVISLSTIHRSKGLEWDIVFILKPELIPHPRAKYGTDEYQQEKNAEYVAITRARHRLYFISSPKNTNFSSKFDEDFDEYEIEENGIIISK
jgi:superfamily I DNA/RNA helicase